MTAKYISVMFMNGSDHNLDVFLWAELVISFDLSPFLQMGIGSGKNLFYGYIINSNTINTAQ